ncbi:MAG: diaminopimelate decarboxylase [Deltaproteobacteria bacterium]|nr:diaminopimelate decarboxylase [Deltaproteobacteria bacterium]
MKGSSTNLAQSAANSAPHVPHFPPYTRYRDGELCVEDVPLSSIAERFGTPTYVYSRRSIVERFDAFAQAFSQPGECICVSVKANSNLSLLKLLAERGSGFDVVSIGELKRVIAAGGDPRKTVFAGVGKTDEEIRFAIEHDILLINVESLPELERVNALAVEAGKKARVALRVNPDVDAKTHHHINTGMEAHKFGIPFADAVQTYQNHAAFPGLDFAGVDCHIGSLITDASVFDEAFSRLAAMVGEVAAAVPDLRYVDIGGGLGVTYDGSPVPSIAEYASIVRRCLSGLHVKVIVEPGRAIFAEAGTLLSRVVFVKKARHKEFMILDAGFNDLIRPVLYDAYHEIVAVREPAKDGSDLIVADVVGPVCETADCFAHDRQLPLSQRGDLIAVQTAGAYGAVMASNYNTRGRPAEVLVDGGEVRIIRPRENAEELFKSELAVLS